MLDRSFACALAFHRLSAHSGSPTSLSCASFVATASRRSRQPMTIFLAKKEPGNENSKDKEQELEFLKDGLDRVESLQEIVDELEEFALGDDDDDNSYAFHLDDDEMVWSEEALSEILGEIPDEDGEDDDDDVFDLFEDAEEEFDDEFDEFDDVEEEDESQENYMEVRNVNDFRRMEERIRLSAAADLERALQEGVVPWSAGVGNEVLPGDYGFDPLHFAEKDYFRQAQSFLLNLLPGGDSTSTKANNTAAVPRPKALILRDLREAEVRHGRLAMLAAVFWPLQENLDRLLLDPEQTGPILYGPITLPYFPLIMTAIMLLLGYLDVYAQAVKEMEGVGEAFLPGDCFWDPLRMLQGAPDSMKRNMQEREILNGRVAMLAFAAFTWEEAITHKALIEIGQNDLLLEPAYEVPFIQQWLDAQFSSTDPDVAFLTPRDIDSPQTLKALLDSAIDSIPTN